MVDPNIFNDVARGIPIGASHSTACTYRRMLEWGHDQMPDSVAEQTYFQPKSRYRNGWRDFDWPLDCQKTAFKYNELVMQH